MANLKQGGGKHQGTSEDGCETDRGQERREVEREPDKGWTDVRLHETGG